MITPIAIFSLLALLVALVWRYLNKIWFLPKRMEKLLREQGLKGNPYRFFFGDARETAVMYDESYSKPIGIPDNIAPRVIPFIYKTIKTYGEKSFMWVGARPLVFILDVELMKAVMNQHTTFLKPFKISNPIFRRVIGGVIRFEGEKWRKSRKKLNPFFHLDRLKGMVTIMQVQCERALDEWSRIIPEDGSPGLVDVYPYLPDYTGSVVSHTLFSTPFTDKVKRTFSIISELVLIAKQAQPFSIPGEQYLPTKRYRRANAIEKELTATFTNMMHERLRQREAGEIISGHGPDLFDQFLDELNEVDIKDSKAHAMVVFDIIQQCKLFFVAGYETTSNLVAWTIIMLAVHQDWQARAREEAIQVLGDKTRIDADDLGQLKILNMVVHEVLRLYPPSVEVTRVVEEETILGELRLPKGAMVMLPVLLLHQNPEIWGDDVMEFKPERFAEGVLKASNGRAAFIPFGWGVRNCIGSNLAMLETKVFVSLLLRKRIGFEVSPAYAHGPLVSLNLLPQYGAPLFLRKL